MRRIRRALRRLAVHRPTPAGPALGCSEPVAQPHAGWARLEAERLLSDDEIGGAFLIGDDVDAPPPVLAEMESIIRDRERRHG